MPISEDAVLEALREVYDPELRVNIVDLGLIYGVHIGEADGKSILRVIMTMTSPACPFGPQMARQVRHTLGRLEEVGQVDVEMTLRPPWTPDRISEDARDELGLF